MASTETRGLKQRSAIAAELPQRDLNGVSQSVQNMISEERNQQIVVSIWESQTPKGTARKFHGGGPSWDLGDPSLKCT